MKKILLIGMCAAMLFCTACAESSTAESSAESAAADGLTVTAEDDVDAACRDALKIYFEALEHQDYEAYCSVVYAPYLDIFGKYLEQNESSVEENFESLCRTFDEDGYESWTLTELMLSNYPEEKTDFEGFFDSYISAGIFDEQFKADCLSGAEQMYDILFSLKALYTGDEEPTQVLTNKEMICIKTADGTFLFG